jgi:hypothetical protein
MRLVRFGEARTGILLELTDGPHVLDVVASAGALSSEDPTSAEIINVALRDGSTWGPLIEHWCSVRVGLAKLVHMASSNPSHPGLVIHRHADLDAMSKSTKGGEIVALGIAENDDAFSYCAESSRDCEITNCVYSAKGGYRG